MTVRNANQIRPSHMPLYCSACYGQYPDRTYVDFDAECDRGYGDQLIQGQSQGEVSNQPAIQMDWLILCDQCIRAAAPFVGLEDGTELNAKLEALERHNEVLRKDYDKAQKYADRMEEALTQLREKPVRLDHRQKPRPPRAPMAA